MTEPVVGAETTLEGVSRDQQPEGGLIAGRPVEDRSFEMVEVGVGASLGFAIGAVVAGPIGAAAFAAGEAIERAVGHAAETTDATEDESQHRA